MEKVEKLISENKKLKTKNKVLCAYVVLSIVVMIYDNF